MKPFEKAKSAVKSGLDRLDRKAAAGLAGALGFASPEPGGTERQDEKAEVRGPAGYYAEGLAAGILKILAVVAAVHAARLACRLLGWI